MYQIMHERKVRRKRAHIAVIYPQAVAGIIELGVKEEKVCRRNVKLAFNILTVISTLDFIPVTTVFVGASHCIGWHSTRYVSDI